ncbi:hypothetical protein ACWC6I_41735 [Streptomyces sp. NPDC001414]
MARAPARTRPQDLSAAGATIRCVEASDVVEAWIVLVIRATTLLGGLLAAWAAGQAVERTFTDGRGAARAEPGAPSPASP